MDDTRLEQQIKWSKWILVGVMAVAVAAYIWRFREFPAGEPDSWGQFGDFLGGVMNPLIAFGAFYWLSTSVSLQKKELSDTRAELVKSHEAQAEQSRTALLAARISTLNIRLSLTGNKLAYYRDERRRIAERVQDFKNSHIPSTDSRVTQLQQEIELCNQIIKQLDDREMELIAAIELIGQTLERTILPV